MAACCLSLFGIGVALGVFGEDCSCNLGELRAGVLCPATHLPKGHPLSDVLVGHEDALCPLDELAIGERLSEVADLVFELPQLRVAGPGNHQRGVQIGRLDGLDEVGHDVVTHRLGHEVERPALCHDDGGQRLGVAEVDERVEPVAVGELDARNDQVGLSAKNRATEFRDGAGACHDRVPLADRVLDGREDVIAAVGNEQSHVLHGVPPMGTRTSGGVA